MPEVIRVAPSEEILLRCSCGEPSYLRLEAWDADDPEPYVVGFVGQDRSFRSMLRMWWHARKCWSSEVTLTRSQMEDLRDGINHLLAE